MPLPVFDGSIIQIKVSQRLFSQEVLNIFYYEVSALNGLNAVDGNLILQSFKTTLYDNWQSRVSNQLSFEELRLTVMQAPEFSYVTTPLHQNGGNIGVSMPPYVSMGIQLKTGIRSIRTGAKRIAGIPEEAVTDGLLVPTFKTAWLGVAGIMALPITVEDSELNAVGVIHPVIVSSKNWIDGVPTDWVRVAGYAINDAVGTQNTRKIGRGN